MGDEVFFAVLVYSIPVLFLVGGFVIGGMNERNHERSLDRREQALSGVTLSNLKSVPNLADAADTGMVMGQVVIATDYFKSFATALRNLVGGEARSAHRLMVRGRREALARLRTEAQRRGFTEVHNIRFGFSNISQMQGKRGAMQVEVLAWGTGVKRRA